MFRFPVLYCPPEVLFLLDGSGSISEAGFLSAKQAVVREIRAVTETFAEVNVGVIVFRSVGVIDSKIRRH